MELTCPACGKRVVVGHTRGDPIVPDGTPVGMHSMPYCETFEVLPLDEYVKFVRLKYEGTTDA